MAKMTAHFANRLEHEKSPYLKQHASNPVDWYPWSNEAFERAKKEDKPVILSIGYSTCHWCHVMERESFEDVETAKIMNENFVNIKIDREERPELDSLYMKAVQAMTGHAGWPLTVFVTPEAAPFYGGSYFPPDDNYGLPSFKKVLLAVSLAYKKNKKKIASVTSDIDGVLRKGAEVSPIELNEDISDEAFDAGRLFFDPVNGGFGRGTKFPHSMYLKFLLKFHQRTGDEEALLMVKKSLSAMAEGGIYDHVGGGFHRYSVDERWDVPHFEKMLYDNALLSSLYASAYETTGLSFFKDVALDTIEYMLRDMRDESGGFYSAEDADVNGEEGVFYLWTKDEIKTVLRDKYDEFMKYFYLIEDANFGGKSLIRIAHSLKYKDGLPERVTKLKKDLYKAREARKRPDIDRKIITAWNGLAISALASASRIFKDRTLSDEAKRSAEFVMASSRDESGRLLRYYLEGGALTKANLEDYALFALGLLDIFEATGEAEWLEKTGELVSSIKEFFYDEARGLFYDTGNDQERLIVRERDLFDNDVPSGNSAAADLFQRYSVATGDAETRRLSEDIVRSIEGLKDEPLSYGNFLSVFEGLIKEPPWAARLHPPPEPPPIERGEA